MTNEEFEKQSIWAARRIQILEFAIRQLSHRICGIIKETERQSGKPGVKFDGDTGTWVPDSTAIEFGEYMDKILEQK